MTSTPAKTTSSISSLMGLLGDFAPTSEDFKADMVKRLVTLASKNMKNALAGAGPLEVPGLENKA
jgi:hypothetical protein